MTKKEKLQKRLIHFAKKHLGKPYKFGAKTQEAPSIFDCSTFIQYLYKKVGIDLPRTALSQAHFGKEVDLKQLEPGDLIFIHSEWGHYNPEFPQGIGHVAIYIGENRIIHASSEEATRWRTKAGRASGGVKEKKLKVYLKKEKPIIIKRIL